MAAAWEARTYEARAAAYAQLMGAIEAFDAVLFQARRVREAGIKLDPIDAAELCDARSKASTPALTPPATSWSSPCHVPAAWRSGLQV